MTNQRVFKEIFYVSRNLIEEPQTKLAPLPVSRDELPHESNLGGTDTFLAWWSHILPVCPYSMDVPAPHSSYEGILRWQGYFPGRSEE